MNQDNFVYTTDQIKAAFWRNFHKNGELWFEYRGDNESEESTQSHWENFLEELQVERNKAVALDPHPNGWESNTWALHVLPGCAACIVE